MQQEYNKAASSIASVPPIWLFATAAACIVPVALVYCYSRDLLSTKAGKGGGRVEREGPELEIAEIYVYPIKSLRAIKLSSAIATSHGFAHDRTFMLLEKTPEGYKNMAVATCPHMTQFLQEISSTDASPEDRKITVQYLACGDTTRQTTISIPLEPDTTDLPTMPVTMHDSPTTAFRMPDEYSNWFSTCFGFDVILVYLGPNRRSPLFQEMLPSSPSSSLLPTNLWSPPKKPTGKDKLTFADCAPYLFCTSASLQNVSSRLGPTVPQMDVTKFRPNVVLSFRNNKDKEDQQPWQEDFWSTIQINNKTNVLFVHNCVRCKSINIDYETGKPGTGPKGEVLKRMQGDRRVDTGARWSPVFGRYAFWENDEEEDAVWRVGDKVKVTRVNEERTVWSWPGLG